LSAVLERRSCALLHASSLQLHDGALQQTFRRVFVLPRSGRREEEKRRVLATIAVARFPCRTSALSSLYHVA
jgi:hypothetical protein